MIVCQCEATAVHVLTVFFVGKEFFESLAADAKRDAEKSVMAKNSPYTRRTVVRRAESLQYESLRKLRESSRLCAAVL